MLFQVLNTQNIYWSIDLCIEGSHIMKNWETVHHIYVLKSYFPYTSYSVLMP